MSAVERRIIQVAAASLELRAKPGAALPTLVGHAAVFDSLSEDLGGWVERIKPGAFAPAIPGSNVRALINHDPWPVLGSSRGGTLRVFEDAQGLAFELDPADIPATRELLTIHERGDLGGMSFAFIDGVSEWDTSAPVPVRSIVRFRELLDVSFVTYPAFKVAGQDIALRSLEAWRNAHPPEPPAPAAPVLPADLYRRRAALLTLEAAAL